MTSSLPRNADVAEQFEELSDLLELEGAESFRVLAYRRAAQRMRESAGSIAELALAGRAKEISGIGKTIEEKIVQIVEDGTIKALADRRGRIPPEVVQFMRLPGLGPKSAAKIWRELGINTLAELRAAAEAQRLRGLPGFGARTAASRNAMLCCCEPVKCCSRLPYESGGTTRRSKRRPSLETTVAFVGPFAATSATQRSFVK